MNALRALICGTLLTLLTAAPVAGHFGADSFIFVPEQEILPGGQFTLIGSDLAPASAVAFELRNDTFATTIGGTAAGPDGHFETTLSVPPEAPHGYIELIARSPDGTSASTWILVGPRTPETGPPPNSAGPGLPIDPSLIVLGALLAGTVGAVGYMLLRRNSRSDAAQGVEISTKPGRTRVARKARRSRPNR